MSEVTASVWSPDLSITLRDGAAYAAIWLDDNTGRNVAEALVRAVKGGVACHAMADGLGSRRFIRPMWWREMREAGVKLMAALPSKWVIDTIDTTSERDHEVFD